MHCYFAIVFNGMSKALYIAQFLQFHSVLNVLCWGDVLSCPKVIIFLENLEKNHKMETNARGKNVKHSRRWHLSYFLKNLVMRETHQKIMEQKFAPQAKILHSPIIFLPSKYNVFYILVRKWPKNFRAFGAKVFFFYVRSYSKFNGNNISQKLQNNKINNRFSSMR